MPPKHRGCPRIENGEGTSNANQEGILDILTRMREIMAQQREFMTTMLARNSVD